MNGSYYGSSSTGRVRKLNEDSYYYNSKAGIEGNLFIVCDGMGGHKAGEVASGYASKKVPEYFYKSKQPDIPSKLKEAVVKVNNEIYNESTRDTSKRGMGTTIVAAILVNKKVYVANVGDSRAYLLRDGRLNKLTKDHSWVEEKISSGELNPEKARGHPKKNVITRCLGYEPDVKVDIFIYDLSEGDRLLLCSDGLWDELNDNEIANILIEGNNVNNAVKKLIISANGKGGKDNVTCIVIDYGIYVKKYPPIFSISTTKKRKAKKVVYALISLSIIILLLSLVIGILLGQKLSETDSSEESITKNEDEAPEVIELIIRKVNDGLELKYKEKGSEDLQDGKNLIRIEWYKIYWFKNEILQNEFNNKVFVPSDKTISDDRWFALLIDLNSGEIKQSEIFSITIEEETPPIEESYEEEGFGNGESNIVNELTLKLMVSNGLDNIQEIKDFIWVNEFIIVSGNEGGKWKLKISKIDMTQNSPFTFNDLVMMDGNEQNLDINILDIFLDRDMYLYSEDGFYKLSIGDLNGYKVKTNSVFGKYSEDDNSIIESIKSLENRLFCFDKDKKSAYIFYNDSNDLNKIKVYSKKYAEDSSKKELSISGELKIIEKIDNYIYIVVEDTNNISKIYKFDIGNEEFISEEFELLNYNLNNRLIKDLKYNQNNESIYILFNDLNLVEYNLEEGGVKTYKLSKSDISDLTINHFTFNESGKFFFFIGAENKLYRTYIREE